MEQLPLINEMAVPRWIQQRAGAVSQIHGFSDASEKGYAAVVYSRIVDEKGRVHANLLAAKTRIDPLKNKLTFPRLELAGATLLAELIRDTVKVLDLKQTEIFATTRKSHSLGLLNLPPHGPVSWLIELPSSNRFPRPINGVT